jgi:hypothetical protein
MILIHQRCFNHVQREAVARCPGCERFFCRECVTEHEHQVVCAACLRQRVKPSILRRPGFAAGARLAQVFAGVLMAWFFFYLVGWLLTSLPDSFHEGTLWKNALPGGADESPSAVAPARR